MYSFFYCRKLNGMTDIISLPIENIIGSDDCVTDPGTPDPGTTDPVTTEPGTTEAPTTAAPTTQSPNNPGDNECDECDNTGLIIGISIVSALLLLCMIGTLIMWYKWIRPYSFVKRESLSGSQSSAANFATDYENTYVTPTPYVKPVASIDNPSFSVQNESKYFRRYN